jgi:hypothetical protein
MRMPDEYLPKHEIEILLPQKVTHTDFDMIRGYNAYTNVATNNRGTAMITREQITLTDITRLPLGRGMAARYRGVWLANLYAL